MPLRLKRVINSVRSRFEIVLNRLRIKCTKLMLDARYRAAGGTVWSQHRDIWLPYHGDGDQQEIYYQMHGVKWLAAETENVKKWLPKGGCVVDVGANTGFTVLVFSDLIGPEGRVIAFEPSPIIYPRLVEVVEKNGLKHRVECLNLGCGTETRTETLMVPVSSGNATIKRVLPRLPWRAPVVPAAEVWINPPVNRPTIRTVELPRDSKFVPQLSQSH